MKRTALARGKSALITKKPLRPIGVKKSKQIDETGNFRKAYREANPFCQIGVIISIDDPDNPATWCTLMTDGIHERKKQSQGGSLVDPVNLVASCNPCNSWVECNPEKARSLGLVVYSHEEPDAIFIYRGNP